MKYKCNNCGKRDCESEITNFWSDETMPLPTGCIYGFNSCWYVYEDLWEQTARAYRENTDHFAEHAEEIAKNLDVSIDALDRARIHTAAGQCGDTAELAKEFQRNYEKCGEYITDKDYRLKHEHGFWKWLFNG